MKQILNQNIPISYNWKFPIRLLDQEISIIENEISEIFMEIERMVRFTTSFDVNIEKVENTQTLNAFDSMPDDTKLQFLAWLARLDQDAGKFALLWDERTIFPFLYGVLGGDLANAKSRSENKTSELTDIEIGILFDLILSCFLKPLRGGFRKYWNEFYPRIDQIEFDRKGSLDLFPANELCLFIPFKMKWISDSKILFESQCVFIFSQTFLRKFKWRSSYGKI